MTGESQDITNLAEELQEQQNILTHCVEQLEMSELARAALVSHLKEALREQVDSSVPKPCVKDY
jgi:regulator of Ty1 transposition protein 103